MGWCVGGRIACMHGEGVRGEYGGATLRVWVLCSGRCMADGREACMCMYREAAANIQQLRFATYAVLIY